MKRLAKMPRGAWSSVLACALVGMVGACGAPIAVRSVADDMALDRVWMLLARGEVVSAGFAAEDVTDPAFRERAERDVQAAREGRATALVTCLDSGSWLASRYLASGRSARARLRRARDDMRGATRDRSRDASLGQAILLEDARRSGSLSRRESIARRAAGGSPGGPEGLALLAESLLARRRYAEVEHVLQNAPDTARLRLVHRQLAAFTGRLHGAAEGLLEDIAADQAVPASVNLLEQILRVRPDRGQEARARTLLEGLREPGTRLERARRSLLARLLAGEGHLADAEAVLVAQVGDRADGHPADERLLRRWRGRFDLEGSARDGPVRRGPDERVDGASERLGSDALLALRLAHEWDLAARATYDRAADGEQTLSLDGFVEALDASAEPLGPVDAPRLAELPRIDYGLFGEMLETGAFTERLPEAFVVGGKGLGMPPEVAWYDLVDAHMVELPSVPGGGYRECHVAGIRVPGFAVSRGARFAGAGLDRVVFLDLDQVALEARVEEPPLAAEPVEARPAHGTRARRSLAEPLETAARLRRASRAAAGADYEQRVLAALAVHERRHIVDVREFLARGVLGKLADVFGAGLLPGAVRAEVERRAQLDALRHSADPRIPLAHAVSYLPLEGARAQSEHARGYAALVEEFVAVLDGERWEDAQPLETWGIRRDRVLLQQLHRLPPEVVRAVAQAIEM